MTLKKQCQCEFCKPCKACNHSADSHMCGDGPCMVKDCPCPGYDLAMEQLEDFAEIDLGHDS